MAIYSSIPCSELIETRQESYGNNKTDASVSLLVDADKKELLLSDIIDNRRSWPHISGPYSPKAYGAGVSVTGYTGQVVDQSFTPEKYTINFMYTTQPVLDIYSEAIEPEVDFTRLDHRYFRWASDGLPLNAGEAPGFQNHRCRLVRTFKKRSFVPTNYLSAIGQVHNASYTSAFLGGITFAAGTLLYVPNPVDRTITTIGTEGYNYRIVFSYQAQGWNKYFRPKTQTWDSIKLADGTNYYSYPESDLSLLLQST